METCSCRDLDQALAVVGKMRARGVPLQAYTGLHRRRRAPRPDGHAGAGSLIDAGAKVTNSRAQRAILMSAGEDDQEDMRSLKI